MKNKKKIELAQNTYKIPSGCDFNITEENGIRVIEIFNKRPDDYHLHTYLYDDGSLRIGYYVEGTLYCVGLINAGGQCRILGNYELRNNYQVWVKKGMKVYNTSVMWRDKKYYIDEGSHVLKSNYNEVIQCIYDFEFCIPIQSHDGNIVRYSNNNTPIMF